MKQFIFTSFLACALTTAIYPAFSRNYDHSQTSRQAASLAGKVLDRDTQKPIAYASVGLLDESTGTISDEKGGFAFTIPANQRTKVVRISAIGYEAQEIKIEELLASQTPQNEFTITLNPAPVQLSEVSVGTRKWKTKELGGNAGPITLFHHNFSVFQRPIEENLGRELGIQINNRDKLAFLSKLNFCLTSNRYDQVKFRVKVYTLQEGRPAQNITPTDILYTVKNKEKGWLQIDLEPYGIYVEQDFAIALEWIDCAPRTQNNSLTIAASMPGFHTTFYKDASQAKWDKMSAIGIGMNVVVQQDN
ncbi:carboxypeptidase-like regulatory domain-containing protein [Rufibacter sp. XAAS-G3-1]|uniref:carboxypeptidase-like regulatory domain-containing protein n=1 Tax=Rufibacter sp. XAAS-G3-1 TaxID=2729134 RepID=UPI0015E6E258|nr:carboxypeptidase-like regulatory domain-containing protein [Rufibacter sp. XAAS-G3-1]